MTVLNEGSAEWVEELRQIDTIDPVLGGDAGPLNAQGKDLGRRTRWLKEFVQRERDLRLLTPAYEFTFTGDTSNAYLPDVVDCQLGLIIRDGTSARLRTHCSSGEPDAVLEDDPWIAILPGDSSLRRFYGMREYGAYVVLNAFDSEVSGLLTGHYFGGSTASLYALGSPPTSWISAPTSTGVIVGAGAAFGYYHLDGTWKVDAGTPPSAAAGYESYSALAYHDGTLVYLGPDDTAENYVLRRSTDLGATWESNTVTGLAYWAPPALFKYDATLGLWCLVSNHGHLYTCPSSSNPGVWSNWTKITSGTGNILGCEYVRSAALVGETLVLVGVTFDSGLSADAAITAITHDYGASWRVTRSGYNRVVDLGDRLAWVSGAYNGSATYRIAVTAPVRDLISTTPGAFT